MTLTRWLKRLAPLVLCLVLLVTACSSAPSRYDQVQKDTTGFRSPAAVDKKAEKGGTFNQFFPASQGDYQVIPYQEKKGFAEYKLQRGDTTVAMLTINDTISLPVAAEKYVDAAELVSGYPSVDQGTTATGLLVNGRYQVKVLSRDASFGKAERVDWLQKFDLQGLAQLQGKAVVQPKRSAANPITPSDTPVAKDATPAKPGFKLPKIQVPAPEPTLQPAG
ncbi:hypothetical protein [Nodosilinea sp. P-1105]|uniref:hypothetical protein n=1 Tax=Nodosilinea sp. P-1105 TaxID=2546229 RepID=UPI00146ED96C|nr:hypothetical protein [Nodosilinea sp. P-1105]NMF83352.1 hypothetical protein [Nodosilinea sp. P-1105]